MAERQSRIRLACAQMALISLIFVTPMATSSSGLLGRLPDFIRAKTEEGRPFGEVLPLWWTPATTGVPRVHQRFKNRYAALQHLGARQFDRAKRRRYACRLNRRSSAASAGAQELASSATAGPSEPGRNGYPNSPCNKSGFLIVPEDPLHRIYWEEYGAAEP